MQEYCILENGLGWRQAVEENTSGSRKHIAQKETKE